ncbi:MAG: DUF2264 domain-containing protein [Spirochaetes bacterium]|uniref:DUF2264 domain-containing protein n=1 Tax=Candidatus Ornithospirochaeta stercoripullorum TaxID=2840899 RepID=A0A9D9E3A2_9SPIO|nr:DUF2264 domain-containing protein [Candidatus Ornithospirochaeta stercoripullorum]
MGFRPEGLDFTLSPYTGLTRKHWIDAGKYILEGVFKNVGSMEDPVLVPRYETRITYPNSHTPAWKVQAEYFEGLARSFFIAAPLISAEPDLVIARKNMREYYRNQILRSCTPGDSVYVLSYSDMDKDSNPSFELHTYQQTVETCAIVIGLVASRNEIWESYSKAEKDRIASFIKDYAEGTTATQNWRLFNMLDLAFLNMMGYEIDKSIMREHAEAILSYYAGDGWYRDGHSFDYYSAWAFQVYCPIWCKWYGYDNEPYIAKQFEENSNELMKSYSRFFDEHGWVTMWGRSSIYRNAATAPLAANFNLRSSSMNPGLARRISSGALMQFFGRDDILYGGTPVLGFYGPFDPMLQGYSCAESPLWLGKAFLCLELPENHPFWTAKEENGIWEEMKDGETAETVLNGPGLSISNHMDNGTMELRTGKVIKRIDDSNGRWCYAKLSYNSRYPWESDLPSGLSSASYVLKERDISKTEQINSILWSGARDGVLYRRALFGFETSRDLHWTSVIDLADFPVPNGLVRADKMRLFHKPVDVYLGSYGFPCPDAEWHIEERGNVKAVVITGHGSDGKRRHMAMTIFGGWEDLSVEKSTGTNPDTKDSFIIFAHLERKRVFSYEPYILISQVITKEGEEGFSEEEIFSIKTIEYSDEEKCGGYGPVTVSMANGKRYLVDFSGIEGKLQL